MFIHLKNKKKFYLNERLKLNLDIGLHKVKNKNMDLVIVLDGDEGSGKSTLGRQVAAYCSQKLDFDFTIKNIHFDLDEYVDSSIEGCKGQVNLLDESRAILNKKRSMSSSNVRFTNYLSECRVKNQVHILLIPASHDLDNYVVLWRMALLINVKAFNILDKNSEIGYDFKRGDFVLYSRKKMRPYYVNYLLRYKYPHYEPKFDCGTFKPDEVLSDPEAYDLKKNKFTIEKYKTRKEDENNVNTNQSTIGVYGRKYRAHLQNMIGFLKEKDYPVKEISDACGLSKNQIYDVLHELKNKGELNENGK